MCRIAMGVGPVSPMPSARGAADVDVKSAAVGTSAAAKAAAAVLGEAFDLPTPSRTSSSFEVEEKTPPTSAESPPSQRPSRRSFDSPPSMSMDLLLESDAATTVQTMWRRRSPSSRSPGLQQQVGSVGIMGVVRVVSVCVWL